MSQKTPRILTAKNAVIKVGGKVIMGIESVTVEVVVGKFKEEVEREMISIGIDPNAPNAKQLIDGLSGHLEMTCRMADEYDGIFGEFLPKGATDMLKGDISDEKSKKQSNCFHEWHDYVGLREVYKYCSRCDAKKDNKHE